MSTSSNPRVPYMMVDDTPLDPPTPGRPLLVHVVVNVERWAFDQPMPRTLMGGPRGTATVPDVLNFSWFEYGMRRGLPRLLRLLGDLGVPASASMNADVVTTYPAAAAAMRDAGWEFVGHGLSQRALTDEPDEAAAVQRSLDIVESFAGTRPRGWLGPGLRESFDTPDVLRAAGIDHVFDWVVDDLPVWLTTEHGPLLGLPYSLELNDSVLYAAQAHRSDELWDRVVATLETFEPELDRQPRVLTLPLHPHLAGVPHRIVFVRRVLELLRSRSDVDFVVGSDMADWFATVRPPVSNVRSQAGEPLNDS